MPILPKILLKNKYQRQQLLIKIIIGFTLLIVAGFIFSFVVFAWYAKDLPSPGKLSQTTGNSTVFLDRNNKILFEMYKDKNRVPVNFDDISVSLKQATVAIEDKNFYHHQGVSETGIIRAFISILFRRGVQGGSTITQQLIKNVLLTSQQKVSRKIREVILAFEVERRYTKDQILEMYLNEAPYGGAIWGVGAASKTYFGKDPKDLNLVESAILAGLPQNPSYYSPFIGKNSAWRNRAKDVLRRMREDRYISGQQEKDAVKELSSFQFTSPKLAINAPHFVFYVRDIIDQKYGNKLIENGVKIKTTLDLDLQEKVEKIVADEIKSLKGLDVGNGAVVVLDSKTGDILTMVGSYDFNDEKYGKFNAALGLRQPGSSVKPITYALAFEKGYTPSTVLMDVETQFPIINQEDYKPVNYDGKFHGPIQLRFALGNSINIPAVKLLAMVGIRDFLQKAGDMGISTFAPTQDNLNRFGLAITLGGGETDLVSMTNSYSVFARGGTVIEPASISEINDFKGKNIYRQMHAEEKRVLSPEASFLISHILSDNNARSDAFGTNSYLVVPGKTVAVKTGTTNDKRDNWAIGYTKDITVGVWVGNNDNHPMNPKIASGITGASPIWQKVMIAALKKYHDGIMSKPDKIKDVTVDSLFGGLPHEGVPTRTEYFIEGTEPKDVSPYYKKIKISRSSGKLANEVEIRSGNYDEKEYYVIKENDPVSADGKNRWQEAIDNWVKQQSDSKYHPPTETSDVSQDLVVAQIRSPNDKSNLNSNSVNITGRIASMTPIKNVKLYINGKEFASYNEDKKEINETYQLPDGVYEIRLLATNEKDKQGDSVIRIGVNKPWDTTPTP